MQQSEVLQCLLETGIVYLFFLFFILAGWGILKAFKGTRVNAGYTANENWFTAFIVGLLSVISLYAIVVAKGITINVLILPLVVGLLLCHKRMPTANDGVAAEKTGYRQFLEVGLIALLCVIVLHLFPESEYKQADSFFYLKIAESLNATGQENINHYYNQYNASFHGAEPYHYFELWITAFIIRFTEGFMPSIQAERFITYGVLLTGLVYGIYYLAGVVLQQPLKWYHKVFCWSLLFIFPNLLGFFTWLYHVFISDFEGNVIDRPNFRIIYLLLMPVIATLYQVRHLSKKALYFLLLLTVASFQVFIVFIPALAIYGGWLFIKKDKNHRLIWWPLVLVCIAYASFYLVFSVKNIPSFFGAANIMDVLLCTLKGWKFIFYSIIMSLLYMLLLFLIMILPLLFVYKKSVLENAKKLWMPMLPLVLIGLTGTLIARVFYLKDNAYQFIFLAHILLTIFIWLMYLAVLSGAANRAKMFVGAAVYLSLLWCIHWVVFPGNYVNIFKQNGNYVYGGKKYSPDYLAAIDNYFRTQNPGVGGYLADSSFYADTYYSRRNPNVYFLPVTYIVAASHNNNIDFCLSDTAAIQFQLNEGLSRDYLQNAVSRSLFFQYRLQHPSFKYYQAVNSFIADHHLSYIIVTKNFRLEDIGLTIKNEIKDPATGERFILL